MKAALSVDQTSRNDHHRALLHDIYTFLVIDTASSLKKASGRMDASQGTDQRSGGRSRAQEDAVRACYYEWLMYPRERRWKTLSVGHAVAVLALDVDVRK